MRRTYDNDSKVMLVELLKSGQRAKDLSEEYSINDSTIRRWRREYESKSGDFTKRQELSLEDKEIKRLKKELRNVEEERDILKKAVSIFSKSDQ